MTLYVCVCRVPCVLLHVEIFITTITVRIQTAWSFQNSLLLSHLLTPSSHPWLLATTDWFSITTALSLWEHHIHEIIIVHNLLSLASFTPGDFVWRSFFSPLTILPEQVCFWWILLFFIHLRRFSFHLHSWRIFS